MSAKVIEIGHWLLVNNGKKCVWGRFWDTVYIVVLCGAGAGEDNYTCSRTGGKARTLQERRLLNCLLHSEYDPAVRPATSPGAPVDVIVDSIVATVIDLVCASNILAPFFNTYQNLTGRVW